MALIWHGCAVCHHPLAPEWRARFADGEPIDRLAFEMRYGFRRGSSRSPFVGPSVPLVGLNAAFQCMIHCPSWDRAAARANRKGWRLAHRRSQRAERQAWIDRTSDNTLTEKVLRDLRTRATHCAYCDRPLRGYHATIDHVVPLSRGGRHSIRNVLVVCVYCNSSKHNRKLTEWRPRF